ncbi:MAG: oligosaccharide flippase family protein [Candidatus Aenigmarchaeota archaeon]|nr:oligosaccharide flippase family protein [Candidatus Aenigmarchaeota archaeon]
MQTGELYKGGLILLLGFMFLKVGGVLFRIICMNTLSMEAYGEVAIFLILFNWFVLFATLNITIGLAKFVSSDSSKKKIFFTASLLGSIIIASVVSGILFIAAPLIAGAVNVSVSVIYWAILAVPFAAVYNIGIFYFRGLYRMKASTLTDAVMMMMRIAVLIGLLYAGYVFAPFMAFVASFVLIDIFLLARNRNSMQYGEETVHAFRTILIYSFPIFLSEFLRQFAMNLDRIVISGFYSTAEAGFYDVAVALCIGYLIIANSYSNALLPKASENQKNRAKRKSEMFHALKASAGFFAVYTIVLMAAGQIVINAINPAYLGVTQFLMPLSAAYIMMGFLTVLFFFANSVGLQKYAVYSAALFAFLSLALNVYLVPGMIYMGAAYALGISSFVTLVFMGGLIWKSERF